MIKKDYLLNNFDWSLKKTGKMVSRMWVRFELVIEYEVPGFENSNRFIRVTKWLGILEIERYLVIKPRFYEFSSR